MKKIAALTIAAALLLLGVTGCAPKDVYADELAKCIAENRQKYEQAVGDGVFVSKDHANEVLLKLCDELATRKQQDAK